MLNISKLLIAVVFHHQHRFVLQQPRLLCNFTLYLYRMSLLKFFLTLSNQHSAFTSAVSEVVANGLHETLL